MGRSNEQLVSRGIDPDIMQLCRLASKSMNRYPVKDSFMLEMNNNNDDEDGDDDDHDSDNQSDHMEIDDDVEFYEDYTKEDVYPEEEEIIVTSSSPR